MIELERTFLAKSIPEGLKRCESKEIIDVYMPRCSRHPVLRLRKSGNRMELTKKEPVKEGDASHQTEHTIHLTEVEFNCLRKIEGKEVSKIRYLYPYKDMTAEIDVFTGPLKGLVVVDFEFKTIKEKDAFEMPDFCLVDITQEEFIAGGMVCGKSYEYIEEDLKRFNYTRLSLD